MRTATLRLALAVTTGLCGAALMALPASAQVTATTLPTGPSVGPQSGSDTITFTQPPATNTMNIAIGNNQKSIINWADFSIGSGATVQFQYSGASAGTVLNRVIGANASEIHGQLLGPSDLNIFLLNSNGILFGSGSVIDVGGFAASTLGLTDADFMDGSPYNFTGTATSGVIVSPGAAVTSDGPLVLIGGFVDSAGTLAAGGNVVMAAASDVSITIADGSPISMTINQGTPVSAGVTVGGTVSGSNVYLAVASRTGVIDALLNVSGTVTATSATVTDRGIVLSAGTSASGITVAGGGGNDTSGQADIALSGSLDSAADVEIRSAGSVSGAGTIDAGADVAASADGLVLGAVTAGSDITLSGGASGIGTGSQDVDLSAGGNIWLIDAARGRDIALVAGGTVTTDSLTTRDDATIRATGAVSTGAVTTGTTVDALGAVDAAGASDAMVGRTVAGNTVRMFGNGVTVGQVRANGTGSDIVLNGRTGGIGTGAVDLDLSAGGRIILGSSASGRDISLNAGVNVFTGALTARDDIVVRSPGRIKLTSTVTTGASVDGLGPVDVVGSADALAGALLAGNDVSALGNHIMTRAIRATGAGSDITLDGGATGIGYYPWDLDLQADGSVFLNSAARGRDVAIVAGGQVVTGYVKARDDIFISATEVTSERLVAGVRPIEVDGAADAAAGTTLVGQQVVVEEGP